MNLNSPMMNGNRFPTIRTDEIISSESSDLKSKDQRLSEIRDETHRQIEYDPFYAHCLRGTCRHRVTRTYIDESGQILVKCQDHSGWMLPGSYSVTSFEPPEDCPLYAERLIAFLNHKQKEQSCQSKTE